jgi:hypothetical protein
MGYGSIEDIVKAGLTGAALIAAVKALEATAKKDGIESGKEQNKDKVTSTEFETSLDAKNVTNFGDAFNKPIGRNGNRN